MSMVFVLLPLSLILAGTAVGVFVWAARRGQFDDLETPAHRVLFEEDSLRPEERPHDNEVSSSPADELPRIGESDRVL